MRLLLVLLLSALVAAQIISIPVYRKDKASLPTNNFPKHLDLSSLMLYYAGFQMEL